MRWIVPLLFVLTYLALAAPASAGICDLTGATPADWNTDTNWTCTTGTPHHVPTTADGVTIGSGKEADIGAAGADAGDLALAGGTISFSDAAAVLTVAPFPGSTNGTFAVSDGTLTGGGSITVASDFAKVGTGELALDDGVTLTLDDPTTNVLPEIVGGTICIGTDATLAVTHTFTVGTGPDSSPSPLNCSAGTLSVAATGDVVTSADATFESQLDNEGQFHITAGTLTLHGNNDPANANAGEFHVANGATLTTGGSGTILGNGARIDGSGTYNNTGTLTAAAGSAIGLPTVTDAGQLTIAAGAAFGPTTLNIDGGALTTAVNLNIHALNTTSGTISGPGTVTVGLTGSFTKTTNGQLALDTTTLKLNPNAVLGGGTICTGTGATLAITHTFTIGTGPDSSSSPLNCSAGTLSVGVNGDVVTGADATFESRLDNEGQLHINGGTLTLDGGSDGAKANAGDFHVADGAALKTAGSGTILGNGARIDGPGALDDTGTLTAGAGSAIGVPTVTDAGQLTIAAGATFTPTTLSINSGTLTTAVNLNINTLTTTSGSISGPGTVTVGGAGSFTKTTNGQLALDTTTLTVRPDAVLGGGTICTATKATLAVAGTFTIGAGPESAGAPLNCAAGTLSVAGTGDVVTAADATFESHLDNEGQLHVNGGTLTLDGGSDGAKANAGDFHVAAGATLKTASGGTLLGNGASVDGTGSLDNTGTLGAVAGAQISTDTVTTSGLLIIASGGGFTAATLNVDGGGFATSTNLTIDTLNATAGTIAGPGTITIPGAGTFTKTTGDQLGLQDTTLTVTPSATLSGGNICLNANATLAVVHTLTLADTAPDDAFNCSAGMLSLAATGALARAAAGTTTVQTPTQSAGTWTIPADRTLAFAGGLQVTGGDLTVAAGATLGGTVTLTGGALQGDGQLSGDLINNGGDVRPGSSPGTLTVLGNFTQGAGGTLTIDVTGTAPGTDFDRLVVLGAASLDGTLAIVQGAGFSPADSDTFAFMTSASRSGALFTKVTGADLGDGREYQLDYPADPDFGARLTVLVPQAPGNTAKPAITGTIAIGHEVTCNPGTWSNNPRSFTFQWQRDGGDIAGAATDKLALRDTDATHQFTCTVTAHNAGGLGEATSDPVTVPAVPPANLAVPHITGTTKVGTALSCDKGTWSGAPTPALSVQWLRGDQPIAGATSDTYTLTLADVLHVVACKVTATNAGGRLDATSDPLPVPASAPVSTSPPIVDGTPAVPQRLSCQAGEWAGVPAPTFTFQWLRDGVAIGGAVESTYTLSGADAGHTIKCRVAATNAGGVGTANSAGLVIPALPPPGPEEVLAQSTLSQVATALGLPPARRCLSGRSFDIHVKVPAGIALRAVKILVNGKAVKVRTTGGRFSARVDLRGLTKRRVTVKVTITTSSGRKISGQRAYRTCAPKRKR